jgi:hypothetical protein
MPVSESPKMRAAKTRIALAKAMLPRLSIGAPAVSITRLAAILGCSRPAAWRHQRHAMADAGVVLAVKRGRLCVAAMPEASGDG